MAGGQSITSGQGTLVVSSGDVSEAATGSESTGEQGTAVAGHLMRLHSRKVGGGAATHALTGIASAISAGLFGPNPTKALSGQSLTGSRGSFTKASTRALSGHASTVSSGQLTNEEQAQQSQQRSGGKYPYQHPYLFQTAPVETEPVREPYTSLGFTNAQIYNDSRSEGGPTSTQTSWGLWENTGGDFIDANGTRQGTVALCSVSINNGAGATYTVDATALVEQAVDRNAWLAFKFNTNSNTTRRIYAKHSDSPPRIDVTYTDGTTETLACRITASATATSTAAFAANDYSIASSAGVFAEFERPTKTVQSAQLVFRIFSASTTASTFRAWLLDPRVNTSAVQTGVAFISDLDAGLVTRSDVIVAHRYMDAAVDAYETHFVLADSGANVNAQDSYDPAIFGEGSTDLTKLPHISQRSQNEYTKGPSFRSLPVTPSDTVPAANNDGAVSVSFVKSSYRGEGFEPIAPGMGAQRWHMVPVLGVDGDPIHDGSLVGEGGTGGSGRLYFPEPDFGNVDDLYVRTYFRMGTEDGGPYAPSWADRYLVHQSLSASTGLPVASETGFQDRAGKCFWVPDHSCYPKGGFSGSAGGPYGWQARMGWNVSSETEGGPLEDSMAINFHAFDIQNNPEGNFARNHNYAGTQQGTVINCGHGGMSRLYSNKWYCIEIRHKLNSVLPYYPGFVDDGLMQLWIDGRHVITKSNMVMRSWPVWRGVNTCAHVTPFGLNQFAAIVTSGMSSGAGYVGVCVRHNRLNSASLRCYAALVSRFSSTHAVIGLVRIISNNPLWWHMAQSDPIPWADGDELRLEASGTVPTVLTVKQNGAPITLKWFDSTTQTEMPPPAGPSDDPNSFLNPASTTVLTGTTYSHNGASAGLESATSVHVGLFTMNNDETNGLRIASFTGGELGGASISDAFAYTDGDLTLRNADWKYCDRSSTSSFPEICPPIVRSGSLVADPLHRLPRNAQLLSVRRIGHRNLLLNWFHGGQTRNSEHRWLFFSGLVAGKSYIGPMKRYPTGVGEPEDIPAVGALATFSAEVDLESKPTNQWFDTGLVPGNSWAVRSMIVGARDATTDQVGGSGEAPGNLNAAADDTLVNSNGCAWFPSRNQLFFMGGGHGGYPGNEVYCVDLPSLRQVRLNDPSELVYAPIGAVDNWQTVDGRPESAHTYDGIIAVESLDAIFMLHGSPWPEGNYIGDLWKFSLVTKQWTKLNPVNYSGGGTLAQPMSPQEPYVPHMYWVESEQKILMGWRRAWRWYDPFTNTVQPMVVGADIGISTGLVVPATTNTPAAMFQFRNNASTGEGFSDYLPLTNVGVVAPTNNTPAGFSALGSTWNSYVAHRWNSYLWDPVRQMIVCWSNNRDGTTDDGKRVFALDYNFNGLGNRLFEFVQPTGAWFPPCEALGAFTKWIYLPDLDCYFGVNNRARTNGWAVFKPGAMTQLA